jgi:phage antirepressor protein
MRELIKINQTHINGAEVNSVNARDLHRVLESRYQFADWIKTRLEETDARENIDYIVFSEKSEKGRPLIEYALTTDIAKEIAMLERNEIGKKVRRYFIEVEKAYKQTFVVPQTLSEALYLAAGQAKQIEALELEAKANKPYISFAKAVEASVDSALIGDYAKCLSDDGVKVGGRRLFSWLRDNKYLSVDNKPYQEFMDKGYFELIPYTYATSTGTHTKYTTKITGKGQIALASKITRHFSEEV